MSNNKTKLYVFSTGISFLILFATFFFADFLKKPLPFDLKTVDSKSLVEIEIPIVHKKITEKKVLLTSNSIPQTSSKQIKFTDSTLFIRRDSFIPQKTRVPKDSTRKSILLFGDSQVEFLRLPVYNYCVNNNYNLVASIVWYSSTTAAWAAGDTLDYYLNKYKPDFVICALGLNELFVKNMDSRRKDIQTITQTFASQNIPYYWIGPAAWTKDQGIIAVMQDEMDTLFYPSQKLILNRASDHRHPSRDASKIWFDSVAVQMSIYTTLSFPNKVSEYKKVEHSPMVALGMTKAK